ncbi:MAG TPA: DUF4296 domain-containing protein [Flavisolibacter sp.]|nr:DUF4296 domain-containing protein [Flavisolibacter sp.]
MIRCLLFVFLAAFISCNPKDKVPKEVLPVDKFEDILFDVMKADELVEFRQMFDTSFQQVQKRLNYYDTIFNIHQVDKNTFQRSLQFYQTKPEFLKVIFDSLQQKVDSLPTPAVIEQ